MTHPQPGHTGSKVGRPALGTTNFGAVTEEATGHTVTDAAPEPGVSFFSRFFRRGR